MTHRLVIFLPLALFALLTTAMPAWAHPDRTEPFSGKIIARSGDAYIAYDDQTLSWEIGTAGIARRMDFDPGGGYHLSSMLDKLTDREWLAPGSGLSAELHVIVNDEEIMGAAGDFKLSHYHTAVNPDGSILLHVGLDRGPLHVDFNYQAFPNTNVIEQWTTLLNTGKETLADISTFDSFSVDLQPSNDPLTLYWVQGVSPNLPEQEKTDPVPALRLRSLRIDGNTTQKIGSSGRSSQDSMGWFVLASPTLHEGMFGGLEWSGAWQMSASRYGSETQLTAGIGEIRKDLAPGEAFQSPRRFLGFYRGDLDDAANASHQFARTYLMRPTPANFPWTQYNTWFAYYTDFDEKALREEVDAAKALGLEIFYVDAGWYEGSPRVADFSYGLGTWRENREKFPSGLRAFADYVHSKGMKFGLWVEPERVDLRYVGPGKEIPLEWMAPGTDPSTAVEPNDPNVPASTAQLCLGNRDTREWMKGWLSRLVRDYRLDWLKWDYNIWMSCDPPGTLGEGNYAHVMGLYEVLDYLHAQFPQLITEDCASGGNRMDYGLMRRTDIAWLSDETDPSYRVRYHVTGASYPFPPEYLNSWLVDSYFEPLAKNDDINVFQGYLRSRMMGAFGISIQTGTLSAQQRDTLGQEVARYKSEREDIVKGKIYRLLPQNDLTVDLEPPVDPDGAEFYDESTHSGVVFLFQGKTPWDRRRVVLKGLDANVNYQVTSGDRTISILRTGQQLMRGGITFTYDASRPSVLLTISPAP
jgi:alpha-galactosidase